ncbi:MAG: tRNA (adenosine(37)-N6)-dimethylallyltransferase MiaA [Actinomycetota bacterium]
MGPTAVGKSALAMKIAPLIDAEIVSVDSATVYRDMDLGTDKPSAAERSAVPHHLIDLVDHTDPFTVADFQRWGREAVSKVLSRGRLPLLVGGSGLYFRAVVDPLEFPGTDSAVRTRLERELEELGPERLYERLLQVDPKAAERIHPSNSRRAIRALEVAELTGNPFSAYRVAWEERRSIYDLVVAGLTLTPERLDARIDERVDRLIENGWVDEVAGLTAGGTGLSATSVQVLGYAQIKDHLDGSISLEEAVTEIKRRTRRFARRQLRWFKADPRIRWFVDPEAAGEYLMKVANGRN